MPHTHLRVHTGITVAGRLDFQKNSLFCALRDLGKDFIKEFFGPQIDLAPPPLGPQSHKAGAATACANSPPITSDVNDTSHASCLLTYLNSMLYLLATPHTSM